MRIGDRMLERGLISRDPLAAALSAQKESSHSKLLDEILVDLGFVTEAQVLGELAQAYGVPFLRITREIVICTVLHSHPFRVLCILHILVIQSSLCPLW